MLHSQLAWYIAGPALGLCVVACRALFNGRLGVTGGYSEVVGRPRAGQAIFGQPGVRPGLGNLRRLPGPDRHPDRAGHRLGAADDRRGADRRVSVHPPL